MFSWLTRFFSFDELRFEEGSLPSEEELQLAAVSMLIEIATAKGDLLPSQQRGVEEFFDNEYGAQARAAVRELIEQYSPEQRHLALEQLLSFVAVAFNQEQKVRLSAILIRALQPEISESLAESAVLSQFSEGAGVSPTMLNEAHALLKQVMSQ